MSVQLLGSRAHHLRPDRIRENGRVDPGCPLIEPDSSRRSIVPVERKRRSLLRARRIRIDGSECDPCLKKGQLNQFPLCLSLDVDGRDGLPWNQKGATDEIQADPTGFEGQAAERESNDEIPDGCGQRCHRQQDAETGLPRAKAARQRRNRRTGGQ